MVPELSPAWMQPPSEIGLAPSDAQPRTSIASALDRARQGDWESLAELLVGFREFVQAIAHHELDPLLLAKFGPSDIVQDTFIRAHQAIGQFRGDSKAELRAWLGQIARRRCRDLRQEHIAAAKRDVRREIPGGLWGASGAQPTDPRCRAESPSKQASDREQTERLLLAVAGLPAAMRDVVVLRNWEGLRFEEVGERMGRSAEAARQLFARAVSRLSRELEAADESARRTCSD